jgi:glutathione-regulated potassium-efflux system protein KefB
VNVNHLMFAAAVMMGATVVAVAVAKKLELGSIVALLFVGMALGPHSPMPLLTEHIDEMQAIGEIGVMLLLFAVGLDLQPTRLWSMRSLVFGLGSAQYALTTAAIAAFFAVIAGVTTVKWQSALVVGLSLAMSSSAIPLPILQERGEGATAHGRAVVAIDILQGLMVVPVLAVIPILAAGSAHGRQMLGIEKAFEVVAAIAGVYVLGRYLLPRALTLTARDLGPGGFAVIVLAGVFFAGWWMETAGISMALGAFMIGVLLSTTVFADQVKAAVAPAKQLLLAIFFIAIGMAIDLKQVVELGSELLLYLPALLLIKFVVIFVLARLFRLGPRSAFLTGLLSMPFDEIAYVILASANANGLLNGRYYTIGLIAVSLSFVVSPLLINLGYKLTERLSLRQMHGEPTARTAVTEGSVVVAGAGYTGRAICRMLERAHVSYTAFELNQEYIAKAKQAKHNVHYGDITDPTMMDAVAIARARLVIVTMSLYDSTKRMIGNLRQFYPGVPVMTAVQYLAQRDELQHMGATHVVALAPEGALSFGHSVLDRLGIPAQQTDTIIASFKSRDYAALRGVGDEEPQTAVQLAQ